MDSNTFISKYLKTHGYKNNSLTKKYILMLFIVSIISLLFAFFKPIELMQEQARKNFQSYNTLIQKDVKTFETFSEDNSLYDLPIENAVLTSNYGMRTDPISGKYVKHTGIDIVGVHHAPVHTIEAGIVTFAGYQNGYGNCIEINHTIFGKNFYTFYAHLSSIDVKVNDVVEARQVIGKEGGDPNTDPNSGYSTGHHLHFEVRNNSGYGNDVDPTKYVTLDNN